MDLTSTQLPNGAIRVEARVYFAQPPTQHGDWNGIPIIGVDHGLGRSRGFMALCRRHPDGSIDVLSARRIAVPPTHRQRIAAARRLRRAKHGWR